MSWSCACHHTSTQELLAEKEKGVFVFLKVCILVLKCLIHLELLFVCDMDRAVFVCWLVFLVLLCSLASLTRYLPSTDAWRHLCFHTSLGLFVLPPLCKSPWQGRLHVFQECVAVLGPLFFCIKTGISLNSFYPKLASAPPCLGLLAF